MEHDRTIRGWLTVGVRNGETLAIGVAHVVALAGLLLALRTEVLDDDTHLAKRCLQPVGNEGHERRVLQDAMLFFCAGLQGSDCDERGPVD